MTNEQKVERVAYAVIYPDGSVHAIFQTEKVAKDIAELLTEDGPVHLVKEIEWRFKGE